VEAGAGQGSVEKEYEWTGGKRARETGISTPPPSHHPLRLNLEKMSFIRSTLR